MIDRRGKNSIQSQLAFYEETKTRVREKSKRQIMEEFQPKGSSEDENL